MRTSLMARVLVVVFFAFGLLADPSHAQSTNAAVGGQITDEQGRPVPGVSVVLTNLNTGVTHEAKSNGDGIYNAPNLPPGVYRANVSKDGFKSIVKGDIELHVQDQASINFQLQIGSVNETVTVEAGGLVINTADATVSTVVDRQFAENLPLNGRSFQTLIQLTPGVVLTSSNYADNGQFSVNGQRASSNYWTVDGVSANIGIGASSTAYPGNGLGGALGSFSALGGTNSLVSVDALQEFRIQTSTYAPEYGRTPGGQISIVTRSGANQFHGTAFDYLRNDALDASDWFNGYTNNPPLPKAKEKQNDFGGTFSGPIIKDRTFFFFSYEGLRLQQPQTTFTQVPDLAARQTASPALQPFLNAFPLDPKQSDLGNGIAQFNATYSNPASLDAYNLRIDHIFNNKFNLFGRYDYSPSSTVIRGNGGALSTISPTQITTQTITTGTTWQFSSHAANDLRFNYSRVSASARSGLDSFGGATPLASLPFPSGLTVRNGLLLFDIFSLQNGFLEAGKVVHNVQRQFNIVDGLTEQKGVHSLKFGIDYRHLSPIFDPLSYEQAALFLNVSSAQTGSLFRSIVVSNTNATLLFQNLGLYAQDTWRIRPNLTITYGLRWDIDFVPSTLSGPNLPAVTDFNLNDLSQLNLAPAGISPYKTTYGNIAPRLGLAYQLRQTPNWESVLRGGLGVFYDLASSQVGTQIGTNHFPFGGLASVRGGTYPLDPAAAAPPPVVPPGPGSRTTLYAFDPHLQLPYTLEWNVAFEQGLGNQQTISASYVGAAGRRLLLTADVTAPNVNISQAQLLSNGNTSNYNALQVQYQRRLSKGLQALASYVWSHSIDTGSAGSDAVVSNVFVPAGASNSNRGPSDFDIRNALTVGLTYDVSSPRKNPFARAVFGGWSLETVVQARTSPPVDISDVNFTQLNNGFFADIRPDLVPGQPIYLTGPQFPGGRAFNPAAFTDPPVDPNTGNPLRQGNVSRNSARGFGAAQWDLAIHRNFPIRESIHLQFRGELFNVLNHPNFGPPSGQFGQGGFGLSSQMLGQSLNSGNLGGGALSPLYQIGGPRSIQLALKLMF
jgi:Carboxypeptidase regulatory-like domain/TonB dependent receptor